MYSVILKPEVFNMLSEAYEWYELQHIGLGERLLENISQTLEKLKHNPHYYSGTTDNFRQVILRNFPYRVVFEIDNMDVIVYAVFHTSRNDTKFR